MCKALACGIHGGCWQRHSWSSRGIANVNQPVGSLKNLQNAWAVLSLERGHIMIAGVTVVTTLLAHE